MQQPIDFLREDGKIILQTDITIKEEDFYDYLDRNFRLEWIGDYSVAGEHHQTSGKMNLDEYFDHTPCHEVMMDLKSFISSKKFVDGFTNLLKENLPNPKLRKKKLVVDLFKTGFLNHHICDIAANNNQHPGADPLSVVEAYLTSLQKKGIWEDSLAFIKKGNTISVSEDANETFTLTISEVVA